MVGTTKEIHRNISGDTRPSNQFHVGLQHHHIRVLHPKLSSSLLRTQLQTTRKGDSHDSTAAAGHGSSPVQRPPFTMPILGAHRKCARIRRYLKVPPSSQRWQGMILNVDHRRKGSHSLHQWRRCSYSTVPQNRPNSSKQIESTQYTLRETSA